MINRLSIRIFKKILKRAPDYVTLYSQSPHTLIVMFVVLNLRYGVMRIKQHALVVVLNGNAQTIMLLVFHIVNMPINAAQ
jgi:hypothetical protein